MSALQSPSKGGHRGGSLACYSRLVFDSSTLLGSIFPLRLTIGAPERGGGFGHAPLSSFACSDSVPLALDAGGIPFLFSLSLGCPTEGGSWNPGRGVRRGMLGHPLGLGCGGSPAGRAPTFAVSWETVKKASWKQLPSQINEHFQT